MSLDDKKRDLRRTTLNNLKVLIIDEISMVPVDMLYMLDLRLKEKNTKFCLQNVEANNKGYRIVDMNYRHMIE